MDMNRQILPTRGVFTAVDDDAMDACTLEDLAEFKTDNVPMTLFLIILADKRLDYADMRYSVIGKAESIQSLVEECKKKWKFKEIRDLEVLWPKLEPLAERLYYTNHEIRNYLERVSTISNRESTTGQPPTKLHVVVSLVRHAESEGNKSNRHVDEPDPLTPFGLNQADALGQQWTNVHIDHLYSSTFERAIQTANAISTYNVSHPEIEQTKKIVEHYWGETAEDYSKRGMHDLVRLALSGKWLGGGPDRDYRPSGGGESYHDVGVRARDFVENELLGRFGVAMSEVSKDLVDKLKSTTADVLPEGIPHIVVVSHNLFITELYEGLIFWNTGTHRDTYNSWENAEWSRHLLCYDMETGGLEFSDMRPPGGL